MSAISCPNCGATVPEGAAMCPRCGQTVARLQQGSPVPPAAQGRALPVIPLAIAGMGAMALVVVLLVARGNPPAGEVFSGASAPAPAAAALPAVSPTQAPLRIPTAAPTAVAEALSPVIPAAAPPRPRPTPPVEKVYECRAGAVFGVDPEEALVEINGRTIGKADDWDDAGGGRKYLFERPGTYYVKLSLAGYRTAWVKIVVRPTAEEECADVDLDLVEIGNG